MATNTKTKKKTAAKKAAVKRRIKKGIKEPLPTSIAGKLWAICDRLHKELGRPPARFEFRGAVKEEKEEFNHDSVSYQYFLWRKFNGVKGHTSGRYPSRGSFDLSPQSKEREAVKKKKAKKTARKK